MVYGENNDKLSNFFCSVDFVDYERFMLGKFGFYVVFIIFCSCDGW